MSKIEHSIDVNVPVREAYDQWTQFESFPQFMEGVESVHQTDDTHLHWIATVGGKRQEWDAEITEQTPDQRIAWTSISGDPNAGAVDFHHISDNQTRITLTMDVQPSGAIEKLGDAIGIPSGQVKGDLEKFKEFIESRGTATGGWRGEVGQGQATGSGSSYGSDSTSGMASERELAGAGSMGSTGSGTDLGTDYATGTGMTGGTATGGTANDPYGVGSSSTSGGTSDYGTSAGTGSLDESLDDSTRNR